VLVVGLGEGVKPRVEHAQALVERRIERL